VRRERQQTIGKMHGIIHRALGVVGVKAVVASIERRPCRERCRTVVALVYTLE
jgi:hypothetical protein